jgi:trimeric autotransporter adhesin
MKKVISLALYLGLGCSLYAQKQAIKPKNNADEERAKLEFMQTQDLETGTIPIERLYQALEQIDQEREMQSLNQARQSTPLVVNQPRWLEVGPTNIAGRTRSMLIRSASTAWAGGVAGGLWKGQNINAPATADWQKVSDRFEKLNISSFAVHPTNANIVYFSTGEGYDLFRVYDQPNEQTLATMLYGSGIWKTVDGGGTWKKLPCGKFRFINKMTVAHNGDLFVSSLGYPSNTSWEETADSTGIMVLKTGGVIFNKLAGVPLNGILRGADIERAADSSIYSTVGLDGQFSKIYKTRLVGGNWQTAKINNPLPDSNKVGRIDLACAKVNPLGKSVIYAVYEHEVGDTSARPRILAHSLYGIYKSTDGGVTWAVCGFPAPDTGEQFFYNIALTVHPTNSDKVLFGGENMFRSDNGGGDWTKISDWHKTAANVAAQTYLHADEHDAIWYSNDVAYILNDGGIWRSANINAAVPTWQSLNRNLNITQFNTCDMSPDANSFNYIGGTQDNGSLYLTNAQTHTTAIDASGGDGSYTFYSPAPAATAMRDKMITSYVRNQYYRYTAGGVAVDVGPHTDAAALFGMFVNPTEVVWTNNDATIIANYGANKIAFYANAGTTAVPVAPVLRTVAISSGINQNQISFIKKSPTLPNTVYIGTDFGRVYKLGYDAAFNVTSLTYMNTIAPALPTGFISYIDVQGANDAEMVITFSNYGQSSVWRSTNANLVGNATWTALDVTGSTGTLPDVPVWSAVFAPANTIGGGTGIKLLLGTEVGVYTTNTYNGTATSWLLDNNSPRTRVTQIKYRASDKMLLMSTYGRGLWRSDMFSTNQIWFGSKIAAANIVCDPVDITFRDSSNNVTSRVWEIIRGNNAPLLIGTGVEVIRTVAPNISNISEWDWISLRVTFTDGTVITQKRRVGEMVKINICVGCCRILALDDKMDSETGFSIYPNPNYTKHLTL